MHAFGSSYKRTDLPDAYGIARLSIRQHHQPRSIVGGIAGVLDGLASHIFPRVSNPITIDVSSRITGADSDAARPGREQSESRRSNEKNRQRYIDAGCSRLHGS